MTREASPFRLESPHYRPLSSYNSSSFFPTIEPCQVLQSFSEQPLQIKEKIEAKRTRTAGASARFRQRFKDKHRETSLHIERLQHDARDLERRLKEVEQDRDFYQKECAHFERLLQAANLPTVARPQELENPTQVGEDMNPLTLPPEEACPDVAPGENSTGDEKKTSTSGGKPQIPQNLGQRLVTCEVCHRFKGRACELR